MPAPARFPLALTIDAEWWGRAHLVQGITHHAGLDRDHDAIRRLLDWLAAEQLPATFFVVAADIPGPLLRQIAAAGHELASHSLDHPHFGRLDPRHWDAQLRTSRTLIEDRSGVAVTGFRAPSWSVPWNLHQPFLDGLAAAGYRYDSSFCQFETFLYGDRRFPAQPGFTPSGIYEIPLPQIGWPRAPWVGGFYLRLLPRPLLQAYIRHGQPAFLYLHPWETYPGPGGAGGWRNHFITHYGRRGYWEKCRSLLRYLRPYCDFVRMRDLIPPG